jgi:PAS domain S-box-containing protein
MLGATPTTSSQRSVLEPPASNIFDNALDAMLLADDAGRCVDANPAACEVFGLPREQLIGRRMMEFAAPEYDPETAARELREHGRLRERFPLQRADGGRRILEVSPVSAVAPGLHLSVLRDITDRVAAEESLQRSEARYRQLIESLAEGHPGTLGIGRDDADRAEATRAAAEALQAVQRSQRLQRIAGETAKLGGWALDLVSASVIWSDEVCAIHEVAAGYSPAVNVAIQFYAPEHRAAISRAVEVCARDGTPFDIELEIITATGQRRWVRAIGEAARAPDGQIAQVQGAFQDITDRRNVEASLRASEAMFRTLAQSSWDVFHLVGADGTIRYESPAVTRVLGYLPEEMVGKRASDFVHPDDLERVTQSTSALTRMGASEIKTLRVRHKDGAWRWVESYQVNLLAHPDVRAFAVNYRDITERRQAEESLRASEGRFRAMANSMSQLAYSASSDGSINWYNQRWYEYTGTTAEQMEGCGWHSVHDPEGLPTVMEQWKRAIASGEAMELESPLRGADGRFRNFLTRVVPVEDATGKVVQWFGTSTDVHDLKRIEASLRHSQERLKDAQRIARLGSWDWDILAGTLEGSEQFFALFGLPPSELAVHQDAFRPAFHPDDHERTHAAVQQALAGPAPYDVEHRVVWPDGTVRVLHERGEVTRDTEGRAVHLAGTSLDITERKAAEAQLAETNRALQLLSHCNEALIRSESEASLLSTVCRIAVTEGGFRFAWVGYALDDENKTIAPQASAGVVAPDYLSSLAKTWSESSPRGHGPAGQVIRAGEPIIISDLASDPSFAPWRDAAIVNGFRGVVCLPLKQGASTFGVFVLYLPEVRVPQEHERRVLRELADDLAFGIITLRAQVERRRLQVALQKVATSTSASTGTRFFEQLTSNMVEALGAQAGCVARFLPGLPTMARTIAVNVLGQPIAGFDYLVEGTPSEALVERDEFMVPSRASERFQVLPSLSGNAAQAYVGRRLDDSSGEPMGILYVLFRDVLRSTEFVSSTLQIFATRAAAELERQKADARLREQAELLDKSQDAILVRDLQHRVLYWNKSAERRYGWTAKEALGQSLTQLIYADVADLEAATLATLRRGEWVGELRQRHKDGTPITVEGRWSLVRDDDGTPKSILSVNTDLTERKKLEKAEEQLRQAQKMEAIGGLAGGVAHDFNNVLSVILSYVQLIITDLKAADPLRADLEEVKKAGLRAMDLTRQLLAFSRKQILQPVVLEVNEVVGNVEKMLGRLLGEDIDLTFTTPPGVGRIHADAGQIEQVIMNLVLNARDAMPNGGNLMIETANVTVDAGYSAEHVGVQPGPYVMLAVTDTGVGMDRATQARIFEPFFTTKDKSKGTGLGLSTVYGIVQQSGGHIEVDSQLGKGSSFKIYLPRSDRDLASPTPEVKASTSLRGTETLLLVEDEEQVRAIMRTILRKNGYHVLEAQNGGEALLICEQFAGSIHLLLTDVVMPRMSGRQLAERVGPLRPEMKVLFVSGYTENTIVHHGVLDAGVEFLAKPIMPRPLLTKVRSLLDQRVPLAGRATAEPIGETS